MLFAYTAQDKAGALSKGTIEADDKYAAAKALHGRGEFPLRISRAAPDTGRLRRALGTVAFGRVSLREKIVFTRNVGGMLTAGLPLVRALRVLSKQSKNKLWKNVLGDLARRIDTGETLSAGMEKHSKVFSPLFISMVRAGEESGSLPAALSEIGSHLTKAYALNRKIKGAMMYPAIVVSAIIIVGVLMLVFVVPTLVETFEDLGSELPASTRLIIFISDALQNHALLIALGLLLAGGLVMLVRRMPPVRRSFDYLLIRVPAIGTLVREVYAARTARTLSSLLSSGVDISRSLRITRDVLQNRYYKDAIGQANSSIQKGVPLSATFKEHPELYPVMVGEMVEVGEETGRLSDMLREVASFYEGEVDAKTKDLSTIIEPVLMLLIGGAVGFFAVSMISPMYSLVNSI